MAKEFWREKRIGQNRSVYRRSKLTLDVDDPRVIMFFAPYDEWSEPLTFGKGESFREKIAPFAFSDSVRSGGVFCYYEHSPDRVLGHQSINFQIQEKRDGLRCRVKLDYGQFNDSILDAVAENALKASVGFNVLEEKWPRKDRRIVERGELIEISLVSAAAYRQTSSCLTKPTEKREQPPPPLRFTQGGALPYSLDSNSKIIADRPGKET